MLAENTELLEPTFLCPDTVAGTVALTPKRNGPSQSGPMHVIHAVGLVTDSVFRVMHPLMAALHRLGVRQTVLAMVDASHPHLLQELGASGVEVIEVDHTDGAVRTWMDWHRRLRLLQDRSPVDAIHLHGFIPYALASLLPMRGASAVKLIYTPHGSRLHSGAALTHKALRVLARPLFKSASPRALVSTRVDAGLLQSLSSAVPVQALSVGIDPCFGAQPRAEAPAALVIGGTLDDPSSIGAEFARMAVILSDDGTSAESDEAAVAFEWIGSVDEHCTALLEAARIRIHAQRDPAARARQLARGWVFVSPGTPHGLPAQLLEAAACGVPCVVAASEVHREWVRDGETGFLCETRPEMARRVHQLLADHDLRRRMGEAAKQFATRSLGVEPEARRLLDLYRPAVGVAGPKLR